MVAICVSLLRLCLLLVIFDPASVSFFFFFNDTATTEIYTLSLHDALPIWAGWCSPGSAARASHVKVLSRLVTSLNRLRSEEHTSELQSLAYLVCRLLLEKKKKTKRNRSIHTSPSSTQRVHSARLPTRDPKS